MSEPAVFRKRLLVRFADVDAARVLYFPRELHLLHTVMEDFFQEAVGVPYADLLFREKIGFPTVRLEADFTAPLRFGDSVDVELRVRDIGRSRVVFEYALSREGVPAASATQTTVAVDPDAWRAIEIPERIRTRLLAFRVGAEKPRDGRVGSG